MKTFVFNREELSILIYALVASKDMIDESQHIMVNNLIETLNK